MLTAQEALTRILSRTRPLGTVSLAIDRALGFTLARDLAAEEDVPPFDNAAMDGFAVKHSDLPSVPAVLKIGGEVAAGTAPAAALHPGEAIRIMTGARIPDGSDAVVQQEWTA